MAGPRAPAQGRASCPSRGRSSMPRNFSAASLGPEQNAPPPRAPAPAARPAPGRPLVTTQEDHKSVPGKARSPWLTFPGVVLWINGSAARSSPFLAQTQYLKRGAQRRRPAPPASRTTANLERTFITIKPDSMQRGLVGKIIKRFEQKGFRLMAMKFLLASEEHLKQHYIDLKDRPFFPGLVKYMNSGPVVAMVWEGLNVVKTGRVMLGETNPADSKPGTIRGDFCIQVGRNIIHGSDSVKSAEKEISLRFKPEELVDYKSCAHDWVYE
ncbi:putative nucleoside diphosphate kinase [Gorilla gorilla gorilla]